jgi:hypothetical protein
LDRTQAKSWRAVIIRPERPRRWPDTFIPSIHGTHGPCALCQNYSKLTDDHIPPESVGNFDRWSARSYIAASGDQELISPRRFRSGIRFKTLCAECNNGLGAKEDKTISTFFERVKKLVESRIILTSTMKVATKPNELYKGLMAHLVAANDNGIPTAFDIEARDLFFGRKALRLSTWSLFYWVFVGHELFIMRNAYHTVWHPTVELRPMMLLKLYPLAFMFVQEPWFMGVPNMRMYLRDRDNEDAELPVQLWRRDNHSFWPAMATPNSMIMLGGDSFGLIGRRD